MMLKNYEGLKCSDNSCNNAFEASALVGISVQNIVFKDGSEGFYDEANGEHILKIVCNKCGHESYFKGKPKND